MTDIALLITPEGGFDIGLDGHDLATEQGLRNAVLVSLFTDRRAADDDPLPAGDDDRRGCWMDGFDDHIRGSRLWLLSREAATADVLLRAQEYAEEALAWMVARGVARAVTVTAQWRHSSMLVMRVVIALADGTPFDESFNYTLQA